MAEINTEKEELRVGLYSEKAAKAHGTSWYSTPDGKEVEVTAVYKKENIQEYKWDDKIEVGLVCNFLVEGKIGSLESIINLGLPYDFRSFKNSF